MLRALRRWRGAAIKLKLQAEMALVPKKPSYELALRDIEKNPYDRNKPWHPAVGQKLLQLPLLTGSKKCLDGTVRAQLLPLTPRVHRQLLTTHPTGASATTHPTGASATTHHSRQWCRAGPNHEPSEVQAVHRQHAGASGRVELGGHEQVASGRISVRAGRPPMHVYVCVVAQSGIYDVGLSLRVCQSSLVSFGPHVIHTSSQHLILSPHPHSSSPPSLSLLLSPYPHQSSQHLIPSSILTPYSHPCPRTLPSL